MNTTELNVAMIRKGETAKTLSQRIGRSHVAFNSKRCGDVTFTVHEVLSLAEALSLTLDQVNEIFFDDKLPNGKNQAEISA